MLSLSEAHHAARRFLEGVYADDSMTIVLRTELTEEYPWAWAVRFDSQEHIDGGDPGRAPSVSVVVVPKTGEVPYFPPKDMTPEEFADYASAIRPTAL